MATVEITLADPWEFLNAVGSQWRGEIVSGGRYGEPLVVLLLKPLTYRGTEFQRIAGTHRYRRPDDLAPGRRLPFNFSTQPDKGDAVRFIATVELLEAEKLKP